MNKKRSYRDGRIQMKYLFFLIVLCIFLVSCTADRKGTPTYVIGNAEKVCITINTVTVYINPDPVLSGGIKGLKQGNLISVTFPREMAFKVMLQRERKSEDVEYSDYSSHEIYGDSDHYYVINSKVRVVYHEPFKKNYRGRLTIWPWDGELNNTATEAVIRVINSESKNIDFMDADIVVEKVLWDYDRRITEGEIIKCNNIFVSDVHGIYSASDIKPGRRLTICFFDIKEAVELLYDYILADWDSKKWIVDD